MSEGQKVRVKLLEIDRMGRLKLEMVDLENFCEVPQKSCSLAFRKKRYKVSFQF